MIFPVANSGDLRKNKTIVEILNQGIIQTGSVDIIQANLLRQFLFSILRCWILIILLVCGVRFERPHHIPLILSSNSPSVMDFEFKYSMY
jgi:hypothetical protein